MKDPLDDALDDFARSAGKRSAGVKDVPAAIGHLKNAIARHERHMNGTEPVDGPEGERSQQAMMDEMRAALAALGGPSSQASHRR